MALAKSQFEQLVKRHYAPLYRFALSLTHRDQEARDLVQEAFARLAAKGDQVRDPTKFKTWLFTTLYREYVREWQRNSRYPQVGLEDLDSEPAIPDEALPVPGEGLDAEAAMRALMQLDEVYRAPLVLFYLQEHSYREIAAILEVPIGTVMSRISRGRDLLRKALSRSPRGGRPDPTRPNHEESSDDHDT